MKSNFRSLDKRQLGLRSEAEAPYRYLQACFDDRNHILWLQSVCSVLTSVPVPCRSLRIVLFGFQILSAGVAFVIGSTQLVAALANSPGHLPVQEVAQVSQAAVCHSPSGVCLYIVTSSIL